MVVLSIIMSFLLTNIKHMPWFCLYNNNPLWVLLILHIIHFGHLRKSKTNISLVIRSPVCIRFLKFTEMNSYSPSLYLLSFLMSTPSHLNSTHNKKFVFNHLQLATWMCHIHMANGSPRTINHMGHTWLIRLLLNAHFSHVAFYIRGYLATQHLATCMAMWLNAFLKKN